MSSRLQVFLQDLVHSRKEEVVHLYTKIDSNFPGP